MIATALVSAFVSNTATVAAMLPIALAMVRAADAASHDHERVQRFGTACMLGIAYAATIGGVMTIIGSPPNAVAARAVESETGSPVSFARWMTYGVPLAVLMLPVAWFVLAVWLFPVRGLRVPPPASVMHAASPSGASIARGSRHVAIVFGLTVALWIGRPWWTAWIGLPVSDAGIAIAATKGSALLLLIGSAVFVALFVKFGCLTH
jgi:sodium-dependent dicarboxylate transporter 2/3/5